MPAYFIAAVYGVNDPAGFEEYQNLAGPTLVSYGGKFIAEPVPEVEIADRGSR